MFCYMVSIFFIRTYLNSNNLFKFLSINNCNNISNGYESFCIYDGNNELNNLNSSKNFNKQTSGFSIIYPINLKCNFSTIINNYVYSHIIIFLKCNENTFLSYLNIINNNSPKFCGINFIFDGKSIFNNNIYLNNKNLLFSTNFKGKLILNNCQIFHQDLLFQGNIFTNQINFLNNLINTYLINHYSTKYCNEEKIKFNKFKFFKFKFNFLILIIIKNFYIKQKNFYSE